MIPRRGWLAATANITWAVVQDAARRAGNVLIYGVWTPYGACR